jgi:acyl-CoA thioester hydrolase
MSAQTTHFGIVYPRECDHMGHLNVAYYVQKFDAATWNFFFSIGLTPSMLREGDIHLAGVEQKLAYKKELHPGDVIEIRTSVVEARGKIIRFRHEMIARESGELAATCEIVGVCLDKATRKSKPYPPAIMERAQRAAVTEGTVQ